MQPVFIFSLPRSGSTLLQRMLATSNRISTTSEPWILLPFLYTLKQDGLVSEYGHKLSVNAVEDFIRGFSNGRKDYFDELRKFIMKLYEKRIEPGSDYFLDKTPRYHLICHEIISLFPEGRFIFLWRNPLAVVSSILKSWTGGKWKVSYFKIDLYRGISNLIDAFAANSQKVYSLQYENLIDAPSREIQKLCSYLGIEYSEEMIHSFSSVRLKGRMGDQIGMSKYSQLHSPSINAWPNTFNNPYRRLWARRYLLWIGDRLSLMGYSRTEIEKQLNDSTGNSLISMACDLSRALFHSTHATWYARKSMINKKRCLYN